jgi:hypothetical protein
MNDILIMVLCAILFALGFLCVFKGMTFWSPTLCGILVITGSALIVLGELLLFYLCGNHLRVQHCQP